MVVEGDFFWYRLDQKARLIKNQQNIQNVYSLFFNFLGPKLIFKG